MAKENFLENFMKGLHEEYAKHNNEPKIVVVASNGTEVEFIRDRVRRHTQYFDESKNRDLSDFDVDVIEWYRDCTSLVIKNANFRKTDQILRLLTLVGDHLLTKTIQTAFTQGKCGTFEETMCIFNALIRNGRVPVVSDAILSSWFAAQLDISEFISCLENVYVIHPFVLRFIFQYIDIFDKKYRVTDADIMAYVLEYLLKMSENKVWFDSLRKITIVDLSKQKLKFADVLDILEFWSLFPVGKLARLDMYVYLTKCEKILNEYQLLSAENRQMIKIKSSLYQMMKSAKSFETVSKTTGNVRYLLKVCGKKERYAVNRENRDFHLAAKTYPMVMCSRFTDSNVMNPLSRMKMPEKSKEDQKEDSDTNMGL